MLTPGHASYGQHLSVQEVMSMVSPAPEASVSVLTWLRVSSRLKDITVSWLNKLSRRIIMPRRFTTMATGLLFSQTLLQRTRCLIQNLRGSFIIIPEKRRFELCHIRFQKCVFHSVLSPLLISFQDIASYIDFVQPTTKFSTIKALRSTIHKSDDESKAKAMAIRAEYVRTLPTSESGSNVAPPDAICNTVMYGIWMFMSERC